MYDLARGSSIRLPTAGNTRYPVWSADGAWIFYGSFENEQFCLRRIRPDGTGDEQLSLLSSTAKYPGAISRGLLFFNLYGPMGSSIWTLDLETREEKTFVETPAHEWAPSISPDGRWVAYAANVSGRSEVYVRPFPAGEPLRQISADGGEEPIWSPKGDVVFYRIEDRWMEVPISFDPGLSAGKPKLIFQGPYLNIPGYSYDYDAVGDRFLLLQGPEEGPPPTEIRIIEGWQGHLGQ
jgi:Tol biopolymer transport system component